MKKLSILLVLLSVCIFSNAQENLSGSYGYTMSSNTTPSTKDKSSVPGGSLVLLKMEGNKYRFWLDVLTGPPGYNRGETDGTLYFNGDSASFNNTFEDAEKPCILKFKKVGKKIIITAESSSFNCGFGNGVNADGEYRWHKQQVILNNQWLKKQYPHAATLTVEASQVEIYQDEEALHSFNPKRYFNKGISFLNIMETEKNVFTEYIEKDGSFIYGWVRKQALK